MTRQAVNSAFEKEINDELEQITVARALLKYRLKEKIATTNVNEQSPCTVKFPMQSTRSSQPLPVTSSKILPLIRPRQAQRIRPIPTAATDGSQSSADHCGYRPQKLPAAGAAPFVPTRHFRPSYHGMAPPVTMRNAVPVFSAPPLPPRTNQPPVLGTPPLCISPSVHVRHVVPVFAAPPIRRDGPPILFIPRPFTRSSLHIEEIQNITGIEHSESATRKDLEQLKI